MMYRSSKTLGAQAILVGLVAAFAVGGPASFPLYAAPIAAPAKTKMLIVQIKDFAFMPAVIRVSPGTTVTWINADDDPHTVTASKGGFRSAAIDTNGRYSYKFAKAGEFAYFCSLHPRMVGKVIVKA